MKKLTFTIIIISLAIITLVFWGNDEQDLGDNYYYLPDYEAIDIGFPNGAIIYKATQKNVFNDVKVHGSVVDVNSDSDFIIASQKIGSSYVGKDSLLYYIIVKKTDLISGPYNKEEYLQKREELSIPQKLTLKDKI
ncbi:MAG: DUF3997 domain-containing protein [Clostridia bacterium]|nr:DUF3997 domain-containing protein [Clostridia bacterium]